jgi:hypothetical protein
VSDSFTKALIVTAAVALLGAGVWLVLRPWGRRWLGAAASTVGVAYLVAVAGFAVMTGGRFPVLGADVVREQRPELPSTGANGWERALERQLFERKLVTARIAPTPAGADVGRDGPTRGRPSLPSDLPHTTPPPVARPPHATPDLAQRLARQGVAEDQIKQALALMDLAKRQISLLSVFVAWRDELPWGRQTPIKVVIASADHAEAKASLADASGQTHTEEKLVAIGRKVRAELSGPNVEITKPEQTVRDVTSLQNVTLEWQVRPTRPGRTTLTLRVFNQVITPDGPIELERPALEHQMSVKIGVLDWLTWQMDQMKGLQWVIGGILAALGLLLANRAKLRRWWRRNHPLPTPLAVSPPASPPSPPPPAPAPPIP